MKSLVLVLSFFVSSSCFALSLGSDSAANVCRENCQSEVTENLTLGSDEFCKNKFVDSRSVMCCRKVPTNAELTDADVQELFRQTRNVGTCTWEAEREAPQNPPSFCSANGCFDFGGPAEFDWAGLVSEFRKANATGACEKTIYANGIYLIQGESVSINAYTNYSAQKSLTVSCE